MNKLQFILIGLFLAVSLGSFAQAKGNVSIYEPDQVKRLIEKHIAVNESLDGIPGYRIQIFSDSGSDSKGNAMNAKAKFRKRYSDINAYIVFDSPNYKVEIGNFIHKLEAQRILHQIKDDYPGAYVVSEPEMEIPDL
ncbi:MAG: SPOR domain-containing protein [Bacteroidales bacterium]|nr:SPOR domain-containing protein [Bacteroidales bacterium]MCF8327485.1 SPOR domain-containing protein [Bacteroidales bacterium]